LWPWAESFCQELPSGTEQAHKPEAAAAPTSPATGATQSAAADQKPRLAGTINIAPEGGTTLQVERSIAQDGTEVVTLIGRVYVWWQESDGGERQPMLLELHADNAVMWRGELSASEQSMPVVLGATAENVTAIYVCGNVLARQGRRTIRADEVYYDFKSKRGVATNAVLSNFDESRGIPIYVRAARLKQVAENKFEAEDISLTTSDFHTPQLSLNAEKVVIADDTAGQAPGKVGSASYDAQMEDVRFKLYDTTIFRWPTIRSNLQRPDVPLKSVRAGHDGIWGTSLETRWFLARLLGLREPEGTNSSFAVDYYSKRGPGAGFDINYAEDDYFGRILGYTIYDSGEDQLGRDPSRRDLEPPDKTRGRFKLQHRQFLPYGWQFSTEVSYLSDENFLEQYYRGEFNTGKEQETLVHLKRIEDNWGLSLLGKTRINDFADQVEELPSGEFHWTGQSFFDDRFTLYSDSQIGGFRYRYGNGTAPADPQNFFTFASTRNEVDMPIIVGRSKVVPFVAGTVAYDDGGGFDTELNGSTVNGQDTVWIGEAGLRASGPQYWRLFPDVKSRLWDLDRLRHIVQPHITAVAYGKSDLVAEQRDVLNLGVSQRWQTKRGLGDKQRTVDWLELDVDFTWLNNAGDTSGGPDRFIWNKPFIPLVSRLGDVLPPRDRRSTDVFGPTHNYIGTDLVWRVSDTTAVLGDAYFDMQSGVVQQGNIGFSRLCWPNLSYYIGSRYLRRFDNGLGPKSSNALTLAATYVLDPRYTVMFSQQLDLESSANIRSDMTLIRKYERMYFGLTFSADETLGQTSVVFSLWPEGVPELAVGLKRYMGLGELTDY
jgi:hypothetical protein